MFKLDLASFAKRSSAHSTRELNNASTSRAAHVCAPYAKYTRTPARPAALKLKYSERTQRIGTSTLISGSCQTPIIRYQHRYSSSSSLPPTPESESQELGRLEPRLSLTFTCTATGCSHRSSHTFTKRAYEKGIVIVTCPGCKNRHLIADHLSWFKDERTQDGKLRTIEDFMKAKGEVVQRGKLHINGESGEGSLEWAPEDEDVSPRE